VEEPLVNGSQRQRRGCLVHGPQSLGDGRWVTVTKLHWNGGGARMWRGRVGVVTLRSGGGGWIPPPKISGSGTARVR
jgi:hypothetical protein